MSQKFGAPRDVPQKNITKTHPKTTLRHPPRYTEEGVQVHLSPEGFFRPNLFSIEKVLHQLLEMIGSIGPEEVVWDPWIPWAGFFKQQTDTINLEDGWWLTYMLFFFGGLGRGRRESKNEICNEMVSSHSKWTGSVFLKFLCIKFHGEMHGNAVMIDFAFRPSHTSPKKRHIEGRLPMVDPSNP